MAPIKFEDNIKDKLDKRTLKPSNQAWNRLSERLDNEDKKNSKKPYLWLGLAASIIGIVFIVSQFLMNETGVTNKPIIVDAPQVNQVDKTTTIAIENEKTNKKTLDNTPSKIEKLNPEKVEIQKKLVGITKIQEYTVVDNAPVIVSKKTNKQLIRTPELPKKALSFEEQKVQDVVAKVENLKLNNKIVTDADINALLEAAQKDIIRNRLYNETTGVVDANALLKDVEAELDQSSFRSKVFEALKLSYNSVKTVVAQRND